jgi:hypothetical protein
MIAIRAHIFLIVDFDFGHVFLINIVFSFGYFMFYTMYFDMPLGYTEHVDVYFCIAGGNAKFSFVIFSILYITLVFSFVFQVKCSYL